MPCHTCIYNRLPEDEISGSEHVEYIKNLKLEILIYKRCTLLVYIVYSNLSYPILCLMTLNAFTARAKSSTNHTIKIRNSHNKMFPFNSRLIDDGKF